MITLSKNPVSRGQVLAPITHGLCFLIAAISLISSDPAYGAGIQYDYDDLGRLVLVTYDNGTTIEYTYDAAGNRVEEEITVGGVGLQNTPPVAQDDSYVAVQDTSLVVSALGLLSNDSDSDLDAIIVFSIDSPAPDGRVQSLEGGAVSAQRNGAFTYTPPTGFLGADSFTYRISDGRGGFARATVNLTVDLPGTVQTATAENSPTEKDTVPAIAAPHIDASIQAATVESSPAEKDTVSEIAAPHIDASIQAATAESSPAEKDTVSEIAAPHIDASFNDVPATGFVSTDFSRLANLPITMRSTAVSLINNQPTAIADRYLVADDSTLIVGGSSGVLSNDSDPNDDPLTARLVRDVGRGALSLRSNGGFTYTAKGAGFYSTTFRYKPCDNKGACGSSRKVTIAVEPRDRSAP